MYSHDGHCCISLHKLAIQNAVFLFPPTHAYFQKFLCNNMHVRMRILQIIISVIFMECKLFVKTD